MFPSIITLSGVPGSGKSTAARSLAEKLGYQYYGVSGFFRAMAVEKGISLLELGAMAEKDPTLDQEIDRRMVEFVRSHPKSVIDGRIAGWILRQEQIPSYNILLGASLEIRAQRVSLRENKPYPEALAETEMRQKNERNRYRRGYNIDIDDKSVYDLLVITDRLKPNEVVDTIMEKMNKL
ncbi:MAG: tRNA pseudouridine 55 synthase [Parcubacteria group bacterium Gr01-1014_18]|nr:MAG: tRNA pseudouridine 55 synthase [Parcubacteria group bacterium Greene0416_36]TSC80105.1 MAG: tRNA pseudouridine 55 synthase [Parcubacteria group bacterium Gr01-1014_18]TSC98605.1 MAG: tRNA pseudouridine 55 synthase [Parcubacteria group bacterium Greene1014_20]TSD06432.1 MAG: tRNA pseudouridine 55 synthase [Parcubacteria group bacterium Greene0714_2]